MKKIAIRSNDDELSIKIIEKLEQEGKILRGSMKPYHLKYMCYIVDKDIVVSPLCLEMWYPDYKQVYGTSYLNNN